MVSPIDRTGFIGGSDIGAILGLNPWKTPLALYNEKLDPNPPETDEKKARIFRRGQIMEPYVLQMFEEETGYTVAKRNERYTDKEYPFLQAEIDAETDLETNIEIKTCNPFNAKIWGEEKTDDVPDYYLAQAMHGLMITGRSLCHFGVLIGSDDFRIYQVKRDEELIDIIRKKEIEFWEHVQNREPPQPMNANDIAAIYFKDNGKKIEANLDIATKYEDLKRLRYQIKTLEKDKTDIENEIKEYMKENAVLLVNGYDAITWRMRSSQRFDTMRFKTEEPELYEQYVKNSESRYFIVK